MEYIHVYKVFNMYTNRYQSIKLFKVLCESKSFGTFIYFIFYIHVYKMETSLLPQMMIYKQKLKSLIKIYIPSMIKNNKTLILNLLLL